MRTLEELKNHMETYKDTCIIIGDEACCYKIPKEKYSKFLNKKMLIRDPKSFWKELNLERKKIKESDKFFPFESILKSDLIESLFDLNVESKMYEEKVIRLHGTTENFICNKCNVVYSKQYDNDICEICGRPIRPSMLLMDENYDEKKYKTLVNKLNKTHTLITVGIDYSEEAITNLIMDYCNLKSLSKDERILIAINSPSNKINEIEINKEIGFHDFYVKDDINQALERLLKGVGILC